MPAPLMLLVTLLLGAPLSARADDLILLLEARSCPSCKLADVDLVHADLRDAELKAADLKRANLSRARLDGANLREADLRFSSLQGASLRGSDLRGARLDGTDLRSADLTNALLDQNALEQTHWHGAKGVGGGARSHAGVHNAGVDAAQAGRWREAEHLFNSAIQINPNEPLSWVARGLSRGEQGKNDLAARDLAHAGRLYADQGDPVKAQQLLEASRLAQASADERERPQGNGVGFALLESTLSTIKVLAPAAMKVLIPMIP